MSSLDFGVKLQEETAAEKEAILAAFTNPPMKISCPDPKSAFTFMAVGVFERGKLDIWTINEKRELLNVRDGLPAVSSK